MTNTLPAGYSLQGNLGELTQFCVQVFVSRSVQEGGRDMTNLRYIGLSKSIHQIIDSQAPRTKRLLHYMEAGMLAVLIASLALYI
ncbi:MAG: hypothetical protein ACI95C_000262 [Pseudohongiellaceae bacterium]|jgi:hypothetical protein